MGTLCTLSLLRMWSFELGRFYNVLNVYQTPAHIVQITTVMTEEDVLMPCPACFLVRRPKILAWAYVQASLVALM